jgi:ribosomal protein S18 acetylase RimI-like enzyme
VNDLHIVRAGRERLDEVEPLWLGLHAEQRVIGPDLGPLLSPAESWRRARAVHQRSLAHAGSFLLLAEREERVVGYAWVEPAPPSLFWDLGERRADVVAVAVLPEERGRGVGGALIEALKRELRAEGRDRVTLGVATGNEGAIRFYRRHGLEAHFLTMGGAI